MGGMAIAAALQHVITAEGQLERIKSTSAARRDKLCELRFKLSEAQKEIKRLKGRLKEYDS